MYLPNIMTKLIINLPLKFLILFSRELNRVRIKHVVDLKLKRRGQQAVGNVVSLLLFLLKKNKSSK